MGMPLVSVITPSYNRAHLIERCLRSVRDQQYPYIEHIVVDGGSSDNTVEVLERYRDSYRLSWISEPDQGMYDAINKGLALAQGEVICYLNTDDFFFPYTIRIAVERLLASGAELVYGDWVTFYEDSGFVEFLPTPLFDKYDMAVYGVLPQPSVFLRRAVFEQVGGFDISYKLLADNELFTRAALKGFRLAKIDEVLSCQIVHSGNLLAGQAQSTGVATAEAARYRDASRRRLQAARGGLVSRVLLARAAASARLYGLIWRLLLVEYVARVALRAPGRWSAFRRSHLRGRLSWRALAGYFVSRRSRRAYQYYIDPAFLEL